MVVYSLRIDFINNLILIAMTSNVKEEKRQAKDSYGVKPAVPRKYDLLISTAIVAGAILLVGLVILNIDFL